MRQPPKIVNWIVLQPTVTGSAPVVIDITDRVIEVDAISEGVGDPSELFAQLSGEWTITADDNDRFFRTQLSPAIWNSKTTKIFVELLEVREFTGGTHRLFKGQLIAESVAFDAHERTVELTFAGPLRFVAETDASRVARSFPPMTTIEDIGEGEDVIRISNPGAPILPGDVVEFNEDRNLQFVVAGFDDVSGDITFETPVPSNRIIPDGAPVEVLTPFPRDSSIKTIAERLFEVSGIADHDVDFSGLISSKPFTSAFNTVGALEGAPRGMVYANGGNALRVTYYQNVIETTSIDGGFSFAAGAPGVGGDWFNPYATTGADVTAPPPWGEVMFGAFDRFVWDTVPGGGSPPSATYILRVFRYAGWQTSGTSGVMFELRATQEVAAIKVNVGGPDLPTVLPDWDTGLGPYRVDLFKYDTVNSGGTWTLDAGWNGTGSFNIANVATPSSTPIFHGGTDDPFRRYLDPERDLCISGNRDLGQGGVLYVSVQVGPGESPQIRRIALTAGAAGVDLANSRPGTVNAFPLFFRAGSSQFSANDDSSTSRRGSLFWRFLENADGTPAADIVRTEEAWNPGAGTFSTTVVASLGIGDRGIQFRTMTWNGATGADSRFAAIARGPDGVTWLQFVTGPTVSDFILEATGTVDADYDYDEEITRYLHPISGVAGPQINQQDYDFISPWLVPPPGTGADILVFAGIAHGRFFILSTTYSGFLRYFDFAGLSCQEALNELAFLVDAQVRVITQDGTGALPFDGEPFGFFKSRDRAPQLEKTVSLFGGAVPTSIGNPADEPLLVEHTERPVWEHNFEHLTLRNEAGTIEVEAGDSDRRQDGVEIESRLLENRELAEVIATNLARKFGADTSPAASFTLIPAPTGAPPGPATNFMGWIAVALDAGASIIAKSNLAILTDIPNPPNFGVSLTWTAVAGAASYRVYRVQTSFTASVLADTGLLGTTTGTSIIDGGSLVLPGELPVETAQRARKAADIKVLDDETIYRPGDVVVFPDNDDLIQPISPTTPTGGGPLHWVIEQIENDPMEAFIDLSVYQKDLVT